MRRIGRTDAVTMLQLTSLAAPVFAGGPVSLERLRAVATQALAPSGVQATLARLPDRTYVDIDDFRGQLLTRTGRAS